MKKPIALASLALLLVVGCKHDSSTTGPMITMPKPDKVAVAQIKPSLAATTQPTNNNVHGTVTFSQVGRQVRIVARIEGFVPNTQHGIHIHEHGDMNSPDLMSTGGHYNPDHHMHGGPTTSPVHAGDFGNLSADDSGTAKLDIIVDDISIGGDKNDILGKAVIIHAGVDDLKSQPSGNSGPRVAGGIIVLQP